MVEFKLIIFVAFFMIFFNVLLGSINITSVELLDRNEYINEVSEGMGLISGILLGSLINLGNFLLSLLGMDLIYSLQVLPAWINTILITLNTFTIISVIFYVINALWFG